MTWLLRGAYLSGALALAAAAELVSYRAGDLDLVVADGVVGLVLLCCGGVAWTRRRESRVGALMVVSGAAWFAGNFWQGVVFLHRGPLVHLHISYPSGRLRRWLARATVVAAYVDAAIEPVARSDTVTLVLAALVAFAALDVFRQLSGTARRAGLPALAAALAFAGVLALGAAVRLADAGSDRAVLLTYDAVVGCLVVVLLVDLLRGRWAESVVANLVVDLGRGTDRRTLQDELRRALGDGSLLIGYWLEEESRYVGEDGQPVELPRKGAGRVVTEIARHGQKLAALVHDQAVLDDPELVEAVASTAAIALSNARLQAEVRARVLDVAASRRRIVEAADGQRRRLEHELRDGAEERLATAAALLTEMRDEADGQARAMLAEIEGELAGARAELRDFAHGVHPAALAEGGLAAALPELARRSGLPVEVEVEVGRLPVAVETAAYFVCAEALTNVAKYADASRVTVDVSTSDGRAAVVVADDGVGGADPSRGTGLRGLADRVEALGGRLRVESQPGVGTRLLAEWPL